LEKILIGVNDWKDMLFLRLMRSNTTQRLMLDGDPNAPTFPEDLWCLNPAVKGVVEMASGKWQV